MKGTESRGRTRVEKEIYKNERKENNKRFALKGEAAKALRKRRKRSIRGNPTVCIACCRIFNLG